jgi:hypothetical protein
MTPKPHRAAATIASLWASIAAIVAGCVAKPPPEPTPPPATASDTPQPQAAASTPPAAPGAQASQARTARDYRRDAAAHLYAHNADRIYKGKMPPQLHAIGVVDVEINARGAVTSIRWTRRPTHAPEVVSEIERTLRKAAPYPAPVKLGRVTYTDVWLWHSSGLFQLDTLTEGQY